MKKILVILTGGTIGSRIGDEAINVNSEAAYSLIHLYNKKYNSDTQFEVIQPLNVLSENMTPEKWNILVKAVKEIDFNQYAGVVITHGSDTLAYSSAMLGMLFGNVCTTIAVIAANYALEDPRSNGLNNFRAAVSFIKNEALKGVYTFYEDNKGVVCVYLSTRLVEADCYADQFSGFGGEPFGAMISDRLVINNNSYNPSVEELNKKADNNVNTEMTFTENVLLLRAYPGMNYKFYNWAEKKPKAVLIALYHSATACVSDDNDSDYSLVEFAKRCQKEGIDVYASSFKSTDMKFYASINTFLDAGVKPMCNISTESAYVKLMIAYNQGNLSLLKENLFYEILPQQV